jgi:two-component system, chemotaxis family, CheB/CheR fusion protein
MKNDKLQTSPGKGPTNDTGKSSDISEPESGAPSKPDHSQQPAAAQADLRDGEAAAVPGEVEESTGATSGIPVVGIGGSAGALESFKAFFEAMPSDSGAAFVIIQHLAPAHVSLLTELLAQHTRMRVVEAQNNLPVEPNCVYVIPPSQYLGIRDGVLYLAKPVMEHGIRMPIDYFLRSLAEDRQERAVCILFSGAGSDGTMGVRAVRGAGGLAIAQDQTAQFGEMPRSAVATGLVDLVLPPGQMPQVLTEYLRQPYVRGGESADVLAAEGKPGGLNEIFAIVLAQTNCDFRCYKKSTILRRIERRMGLLHFSDMAQYSGMLRQDADEVSQLHKDLLIKVTAFFRDAEAFEELRIQAIRPLVQSKHTDDPVRVWAPGCASGEEAYSLAMLLMEEVTAARKNCPVHIFATDIDEEALQFARVGIYPASIAADVRIERLAKFFTRKEQGYQVGDSLRNSVVFADQNLIADPPFSKMDLVSCRNLPIYLDAETQAKLIPLFNFALNPGGYLFLGKSESVGGRHELFDTISKKAKLYHRLTPTRPVALDTPIVPGRKSPLPAAGPLAGKPPAVFYADSIRQVLLSHFAASVVLVDYKGQILQFHGQTSKYLNMPTSEPTLNLLDTAKEGLSLKLRSAIHQAAGDGKAVVIESVHLTQDQDSPFARVTVAPIARRGETELLLAVIFEDIPRSAIIGAAPVQSRGNGTIVKQLEDELRVTQQDLQSSIAELQASNEELRVANEEAISSNEELQSTNEELETSKEELQSVNEELTTVNSQLQEKVEKLEKANNEIANFLESTQIATVFLDLELRIKLFTPATTRLLNLIPSDTGRPIIDLSMNFIGYDLAADARAVASGGPVVERDVLHADGSSYVVRVMPYRTQRDRLDGVVVTFGDVPRLRQAEERARRLATVMADSNDAVILFDHHGNIHEWNRGARGMYGWSEEEALRMNIRDMAPAEGMAGISDMIRRLLAGETIASFETRRTKDGRVLDVWLTATAVRDEEGKVAVMATTERDMTNRKRAEEALRESEARLRLALDAAHLATWDWDIATGNVVWNEEHYRMLGYEPGSLQPTYDNWADRVHPEDLPGAEAAIRRVMEEGGDYAAEFRVCWSDGTVRLLEAHGRFDRDATGKAIRNYGVMRDITERKKAEEALSQARAEAEMRADEMQAVLDVSPVAVWIAHDVRCLRITGNRYADELIMQVPRGANISASARPGDAAVTFKVFRDGVELKAEELPAQVAAATGKPVAAKVLELVFADGRVVYLIEGAVPLFDAKGCVRGAVAAAMDVTPMRRAEQALRESEVRFRSVLDNSRDVIYRLNLQTGRYEYISPSAERIMGFSADEIMAQDVKTALTMVHPDDLPAVLAAHARLEETGEGELEYRQRTKSGDYRWLSNHLSLSKDGTGRPEYRSGNLSDITERKKAEAEIQRRVEELRIANEELSRFNRIAVDRELRMIRLKQQVNDLLAQAGQPPRYPLDFDHGPEPSPTPPEARS